MKPTYSRRYRRSSSSLREGRMFKKDSLQEQTFFAGSSHESFFKPNAAIQRKCEHCEAEDKKVNRAAEAKEEDKNIHRQAGAKEEEKKIQKVEEKKEEKTLHRMEAPKEEEKKIQKVEEKKEEQTVHRMEAPKEEEKKIQKVEEKKEEDEKTVSKKKGSDSGSSTAITSSYIQSLNGKGSAMPNDALHFFSERMGYDFSDVKIHTGTDAEKSAKEVNAKAYAVDNNIVFNKGQYNPASSDGKKLLAHELTHVVQQGSGMSKVQLKRKKKGKAIPKYEKIEGHRMPQSRLVQIRRGEAAAKTRLKGYIQGHLQKVSDAIASFKNYAEAKSDQVSFLTSSIDELRMSVLQTILGLGGVIVPEAGVIISWLSGSLSIMNSSALIDDTTQHSSMDKKIKGFLRKLDEATRTTFAASSNDLQKKIDETDLVVKYTSMIDPERTYKVFENASEEDIKTICWWVGIPDPANFSLFYQVYIGLLEKFNVWLSNEMSDYYSAIWSNTADGIEKVRTGENRWTKSKKEKADMAFKESHKLAVEKAKERHEPGKYE